MFWANNPHCACGATRRISLHWKYRIFNKTEHYVCVIDIFVIKYILFSIINWKYIWKPWRVVVTETTQGVTHSALFLEGQELTLSASQCLPHWYLKFNAAVWKVCDINITESYDNILMDSKCQQFLRYIVTSIKSKNSTILNMIMKLKYGLLFPELWVRPEFFDNVLWSVRESQYILHY